MVAQDEAHSKNGPANFDALPVDQRVHELIFQLRDQNGRQWSQPGWCDIFNDEREQIRRRANLSPLAIRQCRS